MRSTHFLLAVDLQLSVLIVGSWATSAGFAETKNNPTRKRVIVVVRKTVSPTLDQTIERSRIQVNSGKRVSSQVEVGAHCERSKGKKKKKNKPTVPQTREQGLEERKEINLCGKIAVVTSEKHNTLQKAEPVSKFNNSTITYATPLIKFSGRVNGIPYGKYPRSMKRLCLLTKKKRKK